MMKDVREIQEYNNDQDVHNTNKYNRFPCKQ